MQNRTDRAVLLIPFASARTRSANREAKCAPRAAIGINDLRSQDNKCRPMSYASSGLVVCYRNVLLLQRTRLQPLLMKIYLTTGTRPGPETVLLRAPSVMSSRRSQSLKLTREQVNAQRETNAFVLPRRKFASTNLHELGTIAGARFTTDIKRALGRTCLNTD